MPRLERNIGNAGKHSLEIGGLLLVLKHTPEGRMGSTDKQENGDEGAHRELNLRGVIGESEPVPKVRPTRRQAQG
jgi:hypothetical protein